MANSTLSWLFKNFSLGSTIKVLFYYLKKRLKLLNNKKEFTVKFRYHNRQLKFRLRQNNDDFAILREVFKYGAYLIPQSKPFAAIMDFGSHIGSSAIFFAVTNPGSKVYCFEPDPASRKLLIKNLKDNDINAEVFDLALSKSAGSIKFNSDSSNPAYSKISDDGDITVKTESMDGIFKLLKTKDGLDSMDLIKMDVEGVEITALQGMNTSKNKISMFICETHHKMYAVKDLIKAFESKGFEIMPPLPHWKTLNPEIEYPIIIARRIKSLKNKSNNIKRISKKNKKSKK